MTKCLRCRGSGKEPVNYKEDNPKVTETKDCLDCKGRGSVVMTDKTFRLDKDGVEEIKRGNL